MASFLRLWLSVAIYQQLIVLVFGKCNFSKQLTGLKCYCYNAIVEDVADFIPSNVTEIKFWTSKQIRLSLPFRSYFPNLNSLAFIDGHLETIEPNSLHQLSELENLAFPNNKLSRFDKYAFSGLVHLKILELQRNEFAFLEDVLQALLFVGNLTYLDLSYNLFESISFEEAEKLANVTVGLLKLIGCRINNVDPLVLRYWNIDELLISNNPMDEKCVTNVSLGVRNSNMRRLEMKKLSSLAFSFNETPLLHLYDSQIQSLVIGENEFTFKVTLRSFFSLNDLEFTDSGILDIEMDEWLNLPNLERIKLKRNNIERFSYRNKFANGNNVPVLKTLELERNRSPYPGFSVIPSDFFASLSNLLDLTMYETLFGNTITTRTFPGLRKLLKLKVTRCSIEEIEDGAFSDLESLQFLTLRGNKLRSLRNEMFIGLHNLTLLDLSLNILTLVTGSSPFSLLTNLDFLDLRENEISHLRPSFFANLTKVSVIILNNNMIRPWDTRVIPENGNMSHLLLRSNNLSVITPTMLEDFNSLELVDLADNNFDCWNCNTPIFQRWIASNNLTLLDVHSYPEKYACQYPESLKGESIVTAMLDTQHCEPPPDRTILLVTTSSCIFALAIILGIASYRLRWHFHYCCYLLRSHVKRFKEVQDSIPYQYDAFVSYDSSDINWIRNHLLATLEEGSHRIKFCLLERDCVAGRDLTEEIFDVVQKCRKTLVVLSQSYLKNQWCVFEMQMAQHSLFEKKRDSLILIQLQPIEKEAISANLSYLINTRTYIVWAEHSVGQKIFWRRLLAALAKPDTLSMSHIV